MGRNINGEFEFDVIRHKDTAAAWSQELKVIFVLRGNGWLHTEEGDRTYAISREDIFAINSFQMHSVVLEENGLAISLSLSPSFLAAASPETEDRSVNCKSFLHEEEKQQLFDIIRKDFWLWPSGHGIKKNRSYPFTCGAGSWHWRMIYTGISAKTLKIQGGNPGGKGCGPQWNTFTGITGKA